MLVQDGKIGLEEPIHKYIPESPESWKDITAGRELKRGTGDEIELLSCTHVHQ